MKLAIPLLLGFIFVGIAPPAQRQGECSVRGRGNWSEPVNEVIVRGDTAFVAVGRCLDIVEVTDPTSPSRIGRLIFPDMAEDIALVGATAYVANGRAGLRVVDLSAPSHPLEVGFLAFNEEIRRVSALTGNAVLVAGAWLHQIDATDASAPIVDDSLNTPSSWPLEIAVAGEIAFVSSVDSVFVVSSAAHGHLRRIDAFASLDTRDILLGDSLAYMAEQYAPSGELGRLRIVNYADPENVFDVGAVATRFGYDVGVSGRTAIIGGANGDVQVFDVSDPTRPAFITAMDDLLPQITNPASVTVDGSTAFIGHVSDGLYLFDISDPLAPAFLSRYNPLATFAEMPSTVSGARLSLAAHPNPVTDIATVRLTLSESTRVTLTLFDVLGRQIRVLHDAFLPAGTDAFQLQVGPLPAGTYVIRADTDRAVATLLLAVSR